MDIYLTEQDQIDAIKRWWKTYGMAVILGILFALIGSYFWRYWQAAKENNYLHASMRYEELLTGVANNDDKAIVEKAEYLIKRYPKTYYAKLASLLLAEAEINQRNYPVAENKLDWVVQHGNTGALRQIARIRLARVLLAENKSQAALDLLRKIDDRFYQPLVEDVKGDAYLALGQPTQAKEAYRLALSNAPELATMYPLLQMKLDNVNNNALAGTRL